MDLDAPLLLQQSRCASLVWVRRRSKAGKLFLPTIRPCPGLVPEITDKLPALVCDWILIEWVIIDN